MKEIDEKQMGVRIILKKVILMIKIWKKMTNEKKNILQKISRRKLRRCDLGNLKIDQKYGYLYDLVISLVDDTNG
jgi:hypothetical protein